MDAMDLEPERWSLFIGPHSAIRARTSAGRPDFSSRNLGIVISCNGSAAVRPYPYSSIMKSPPHSASKPNLKLVDRLPDSPADGIWAERKKFIFSVFGDTRVLVIGVGGGCDVISAHLIGRMIKAVRGNEKTRIILANAKKVVQSDFQRISPHIFKVPAQVIEIVPEMTVWKTTLIEQSVPRWEDGSPFLIIAPKELEDYELVADEIAGLNVAGIVAVDTGGDSLKGKPARVKVKMPGRDIRMMRALELTDIPMLHVVVAPGSDGETLWERMQTDVSTRLDSGHYQGWFSLAPQLDELRRLASNLTKGRTPQIILKAFDGRLKTDGHGLLEVPRFKRPFYPQKWLVSGLVFSGA